MPEFLERKLKKEYGNNDHAIYGTMNKLGYMRGNKETKKGEVAEKKHEIAKKMKHSWEEWGKTGKAVGKSVSRHVKKERLPF
jgi:hypothetical protein